jgi:hypothetical protein
MDEDDEPTGIACQFCGGEERLTFMLLPTGNGDNRMVTACAACTESVYDVKRQLDDSIQYHRDRQARMTEHSHFYGLAATMSLAAGATAIWGVGGGFLALGGALTGLCVLRAIQS